MSFCTAVNCIDGRVELPVIRYLQQRFGVLYVDLVTEPGAVRSLAGPADTETKRSILRRVAVSLDGLTGGSRARKDYYLTDKGREVLEIVGRQLAELKAEVQ